jgi:hypothetical protein
MEHAMEFSVEELGLVYVALQHSISHVRSVSTPKNAAGVRAISDAIARRARLQAKVLKAVH